MAGYKEVRIKWEKAKLSLSRVTQGNDRADG